MLSLRYHLFLVQDFMFLKSIRKTPLSVPVLKLFLSFMFSPRTCVDPKLKLESGGDLWIDYLEKTTSLSAISDQGVSCVNTVELIYIISFGIAILFGLGNVQRKPHIVWAIFEKILIIYK